MANSPYRPTPSRNAAASENAKIARLRDKRMARESALREAGTWGEMTVGEIVHEHTGDVFVMSWKGNKPPDLARLLRIRLPDLTLPEHERLQDWLSLYGEPEFRQSVIGWSLSRAEAKRVKETRIVQHRASGRRVVNDAPPAT